MKKKLLLIILVIVSVILLIIRFKIINKPIYGNDPDSIVEVITSIDLYEGKSIDILEIYDFDDDRIVTFLSNSSPSIIEFETDEKGNYIMTQSETRQNEDLSQFTLGHIGNNDEVIIFNVKNQLCAINNFSFKANEKKYNVEFDLGHPNSQWTKLEKSEDNSYEFEWYYPEE